MVYCSSCGTANRDGSSFCNDCGAKLPSGTSLRCPQCGTPNSPSDTFCQKCGTRLVPTLAEDAPAAEPPAMPLKKGLSLPIKPDADASPASADSTGATSPQSAAAPPAGEVPDWLTSLGIISNDNPPMAAAADEDVPEWLSQLPLDATPPAENSSASDASTGPADWLSNLRTATPVDPASNSDEDIPDWMRALGTGPLSPPADSSGSLGQSATSTDDEDIPDWLRTLGTGPLSAATAPEDAADQTVSPRAAESAIEPGPPTEVDPAESAPADQPPAPEELPDWLRNLGAADHSQRSTDELPEWLDSLGTESAAPEASAAESEAPAEDDVPAWLRDLGASAVTQPAESPQVDLSAAESSDWVSALRGTVSQPTESVEPESEPIADEVPDWLQTMGLPRTEQTPTPATDEVDWMSSLRATASQPTESIEPESESVADEVPDWLQTMGLPTTEQTPTPATDEADWMSALRDTASQPTESVKPESESVADEVPDWLHTMGVSTTEQTPTPATDEADWMSALRDTASQPTESVEPESESVADEVPDWLHTMGLPTTEQTPTPATDEADWMSALRDTASQPAESVEPESESVADEVPDWLQAMGLPAAEQAPTPATDEADWMSALRGTASPSTESAEPVNETTADDVPDWLRNFDEPTAQSAVAETPVLPSTADDVPDWLRDGGADIAGQQAPIKSGDLPDWLQDTAVTPEPEPARSIEPASEMPTWLSDLRPMTDAPSSEDESAQPERPDTNPIAVSGPGPVLGHVEEQPLDQAAIPSELPEWLKSLREGKVAAPIQAAEPLPGLIQAEIPNWLEALRPKEGQTTTVADLTVESDQEGIFAGLANVLPPFPDLDELPAQVSINLAGTSADDLAQAGIFQELLTRPISRPTAVAALTTTGKPAQRRLMQWTVALLLLAAVVAPFLELTQGLPFLPQADQLPSSALAQAAATRITVLPPNANVLVVFDYEPAQAGEMNQIAEVLLRHLQTRAANITVMSLNPLGADLAASMWAALGDSTGGQRTNLGYVPGQAIGVQSVLLNHGPFELVIDLAASSDSIRWWVEQIAVSGFDVPLIAGVSAAVESLALPYAQSAQIRGLISGAVGAMMYARQANLLPSLQEALQAVQVARDSKQPPSTEVVRAVRNQVQIESQTLAHWLLAILIVIGLVSGLVSRAGRRSAS